MDRSPGPLLPAALAPMTLLATMFASASAPLIVMPERRFPEMMFRPATPMRFAGASKMATPSPLPTAVLPDGSVPMKLPSSRLPVVPARLSVMPFRVLPEITLAARPGPPIALFGLRSRKMPSLRLAVR